jgi:hypothetical protein
MKIAKGKPLRNQQTPLFLNKSGSYTTNLARDAEKKFREISPSIRGKAALDSKRQLANRANLGELIGGGLNLIHYSIQKLNLGVVNES